MIFQRVIWRQRQAVQRVTPNFGNKSAIKGGARGTRPNFKGPQTGPLTFTVGVPIEPIHYRDKFSGPGIFGGLNIPPGLTIGRESGILSGTPTGAGTFPMGIFKAFGSDDVFATTGTNTVTVNP